MTPLIAITGGIGSGKSAICHCLSTWGFQVYDCDSRAKALMDRDPQIHRRLREEISPDTVTDGTIDRHRLSEIVFSNPEKLNALNSIVHGRVTEDLLRWRNDNKEEPLLFVETAILLESNLHNEVDEVWLADAPETTRLRRACLRDSVTEEAIIARMRRQRRVCQEDITVPLLIVENDGHHPVIPQLSRLLARHGAILSSYPGQWKN